MRETILQTAIELFTQRGYDATSLRNIAEAVGLTKSSLYHHFPRKEAIVEAVMAGQKQEIDDLLDWIDQQPDDGDLLLSAALHWVDTTGPRRLVGMRFARANQPLMHRLRHEGNDRSEWFTPVLERVLPGTPTSSEILLGRMTFDTIGAALAAADGLDVTDQEILDAAHASTVCLAACLRSGGRTPDHQGNPAPANQGRPEKSRPQHVDGGTATTV